MSITQQTLVLSFQDPGGNPLANGTVTFRLQQDVSDANSGGPQVSAGRLVSVQLDDTGFGIIQLWQGTFFAQAYTALGQPVWKGSLNVGIEPSYILLEDGTLIFLESGQPQAILTEIQP